MAVEERRSSGKEILDLTVSNPTLAGLDYPRAELERALAEGSTRPYHPSPLGLHDTRSAIAEFLSSDDDVVSPEDIVVTASTSEAYGFLFKLLCDRGESVLTHTPEYPLLDQLAMLEGIRLRHFPLEYISGAPRPWRIDADEIRKGLVPDVRVIVVIHPNNPTGSFVSSAEMIMLSHACGDEIALISDEVFAQYILHDSHERAGSASSLKDGLVFSLGGLAKSAGLPHWKLGWIRLGGDSTLRSRARQALETIADAYLSVSTPIQIAAITVLQLAPAIREQILRRLRTNLETIARITSGTRSIEALPVEGGWSVVLRLPAISTDEELAIGLLESCGVLAHPGYLYEFDRDGYLVLSLLTSEHELREGVTRLSDYVTRLA